ncbi:MAG: TonB-dependent receptor [Bacteroidetes bacterium]|nr:TonB-dependent receptor [Bacteroidota bacterium]
MMKGLFLLVLSVASASSTFGQTGTIKGIARDKVGEPIINATIIVKPSLLGTSTNEQGSFILSNIPSGKVELHFSKVGYTSIVKTILVEPNKTIDVFFEAEERIELLENVDVSGVRSITGMGYLDNHSQVIYTGKKTEVILLDSLDANTSQNNPRQVLGRVPGANYSETEASGFPSNGIGFRGLNPTQSIETNARQNGYNITADLYGYPESYYLPALEAVERIEVTRGAASLQFGPQFGGVINYIMKKPSMVPLEITTQQTGGSFGMYNSFTSAGGQSGKLSYYSYLQYQGAQGWRPNSDYKKITGYARLGYSLSDKLKVGVEYSILRNRLHMPGGFTDSAFYANSRASFRARNWLTSPWNILTLTLDWKINSLTSLSFKSSFNESARDLVWRNEDGGPQAMDLIDPTTNMYVNREVEHEGFKSNTSEARLLTHYRLWSVRNTLATGVRFFSGKMKRQGGGVGTTGFDFDLNLVQPGFEYDLDFTTTNLAAFIENTFHVSEKFSVTPGFRYEYINSTIKGYNPSEDETAVIYSDRSKNRFIFLSGVGLQFEISNTTNVYANWSQAYRPMDYSSLTPFGTIITVDQNLKDSGGFNSDLGFRGSVKNFLNFDVGGFLLHYNNRIGVIEKTDASGNQFPYRTNVAASVHKGIESYVEFNPVKALTNQTKWSVSFFNSLALIDAKYTTGEFNGKYVEYAPTMINRFGLNASILKFSTTFLISNTSKAYSDAGNSNVPSADAIAGIIPAYRVMDWSATFHLGNYNMKFGVNNLTDTRYFTLRTGEYPGPGIIPSIGRSFYFGVGAKF